MANYGSNPGSDDEEMFGANPKQKMDEGDGMDEEGLLPKSLMAGKDFKPGDEIVLEVTAVHEKDFSVRYAKDKGSEKSDGEHEGMDAMTKTADSEMEGAMY